MTKGGRGRSRYSSKHRKFLKEVDPEGWRYCFSKRKYKTKEEAEITVEKLKQEKPLAYRQDKLNVYACDRCFTFHIGKSKFGFEF